MTGPDTVTLDGLTPGDAEACAALEVLLFPGDDPWSAEAFRAELGAGHLYLAARADGRLVGYGGLAVLADPPGAEAEIHTLGVHPDRQGTGLGRRLLAGLLARADALRAVVYLEVRTDNEPALGLYRAAGFQRVGVRRGYYRPSGADAYTMRRPAHRPAAPTG